MNAERVTLISHSLPHFGQFSSYHRLLHYAGDCRRVDVGFPFATFLPPSWQRKLAPVWRRWEERRLRQVFSRRERQCVHYLFPGQTLFRGHEWKGRHGLVLTLHAPPGQSPARSGIKSHAILQASKLADRIIALSTDSLPGYARTHDPERLVVIPHGVDVHFFQPPAAPENKKLVLTVGNWLRDYETWAEVALRLAAVDAEVEFAVVAAPASVASVRARVESSIPGRVHFLPRLDDASLRKLYQQAAVAFLPLTGATANNALLEAMACGTPSLVTDLPAAREYAGDGAEYFAPSAVADCTVKLQRLLHEAGHRMALGQVARHRAVEHFSWEVIARRHLQLYAEILAES